MIDAELIPFAERLADAAGAAIRPYFRTPFTVETKADLSPVTAADRASETAIRQLIEAHYPDHGIIGEELGSVREATRFVWVLDPIDGTRAFIAGRPLFGTLIALLDDGIPVLGIIDQPIAGDRWVGATGRQTLFNGSPASTRQCPELADAYAGTTSPQAFDSGDFACFERLRANVREVLYGGDCHNYGLLASGWLDLVVEAGLKLHDFAALVPVIEGAGGVMRDWSGKPLHMASDGRVIAAGDVRLMAGVVAGLSA